jgi:CBS domain-containing protein
MITAAATAVGINMTFLLPYSMLRKGWDRESRGLAIFDLSTGLFIPFVLATGCVVIATAAQFHAKPQPGVMEGTASSGLVNQYQGLLRDRLQAEVGPMVFADMTDTEKAIRIEALPETDKQLAAMLVRRDAFDLAQSLERLTGRTFSHYVFGIGVLGMALSTNTAHDIGQLPVVIEDECVGSITETRLMARVIDDPGLLDKPVEAVMGPPFPVLDGHVDSEEVVQLMKRGNAACLVRDHGRLTGIVTRYDVVRVLTA